MLAVSFSRYHDKRSAQNVMFHRLIIPNYIVHEGTHLNMKTLKTKVKVKIYVYCAFVMI